VTLATIARPRLPGAISLPWSVASTSWLSPLIAAKLP